MGQWLGRLVMVFLPALVLVSADTGKRLQPLGDEPVWLTDYAEARQLAVAAGKPLLVVFRCQH